jgi:hypothetical protein
VDRDLKGCGDLAHPDVCQPAKAIDKPVLDGRRQEHVAPPHMEWGRRMAFVNHFCFYLWDPDWGEAFWKTNALRKAQIEHHSPACHGQQPYQRLIALS